MTEDLNTLEGTRDAAWRILEEGVVSRDHPARTVALATQALAGGGAVRMVILRGVDRRDETLVFYTHRNSSKVPELLAIPRAEVVVWIADKQFQMRLRGEVAVTDGPSEVWEAFGEGTRQNYTSAPMPGTVLDQNGHVSPEPDPTTFVMLTLKVDALETLWLGGRQHRRALFTNGHGCWLAP